MGAAVSIIGSFIIPVLGIIILFNLLKKFEKSQALDSIFKGVKSATWGLIIGLGVKSLMKTNMNVENIIIGAGASIGIAIFNLSPALIIISAGLLGLLFYR